MDTIKGIFLFLAASVLIGLSVCQAQSPLPATNTPLPGCIEGRALRVINGVPGCSPVGAPSVSSCGTGGSINSTSTDFVGQITTGTGLLTSCVISLSKLYNNPGLGCFAQSNSSTAVVAGSPVVDNSGAVTKVTISLTLSLPGGKIFYICSPV